MEKENQPLGMPKHYTEIGEALARVYGENDTAKQIQDNIDALKSAHKMMDKQPSDTKLNIAFQIDFWSQILQSIKPPVLKREFFEGLNTTPKS